MEKALTIRVWLPVRPELLYSIWLSSRQLSEFTGSPANIDSRVGGSFTVWNGFISGRNLVLIPGRQIVQAWRTTDFPADAPDSTLDLTFEAYTGGTVLTLVHRDLPADQVEDYRLGWTEQFLQPLKDYLEQIVDGEDMH
ncbi:MAG: SRPBCC domain-containing protein [Anaerolineaceae bacterium]